jgi:hypothetical protein
MMNMEMNYKKIIKEKMLDDAKAHGYKLTSERPCFSRWDVASFDKYEDEYNCSYSITISYIPKDQVYLGLAGDKITRTFKGGEEEFKNIIDEFAAYMRNEGFDAIEAVVKKPRFKIADNVYFFENHEALADEFCRNNDVPENADFIDKIYYINDRINDLKGMDFETAKPKMMALAAYFTRIILERGNLELVFDEIYAAIRANHSYSPIIPLRDILSVWLGDNGANSLKFACEQVLLREEYEAIDWKI